MHFGQNGFCPNKELSECILAECPLEVLDLCTSSITDSALEKAVSKCKNTLKELRLAGCKRLKNPKIECKILEYLDLSNTEIQNGVVESILEKCGKYLRGKF